LTLVLLAAACAHRPKETGTFELLEVAGTSFAPGDVITVDVGRVAVRHRSAFCWLYLQRTQGGVWLSSGGSDPRCRDDSGLCCRSCDITQEPRHVDALLEGCTGTRCRIRLGGALSEGEYRLMFPLSVSAEQKAVSSAFRVAGAPRPPVLPHACAVLTADERRRQERDKSRYDRIAAIYRRLSDKLRDTGLVCTIGLGGCHLDPLRPGDLCASVTVRQPEEIPYGTIPREFEGLRVEVKPSPGCFLLRPSGGASHLGRGRVEGASHLCRP
jgi:hypothetical protein